MATYLGVDLGATTIRAVVGDRAGRVVGADRTPTPAGPTSVAITEAVLDTVRGACGDAGVDPESVVAAGVGAVGPLDHDAGVSVDPTNLPADVGRIPLVDPLRTLLSTDRTHFHNDATAGAIGERFFRDGGDDLVYLTLSTGVGAGAVVDGHVLSGWDGNAAELGHVTLDASDDARICNCGGTGHWEAYCGGANVAGYARDLHDGEATALDLDDPDLGAAGVFDAAADGDEFAARVIDRIGRWNALGVATVVHAYAPRVVAVGGGVARNNPDRILGPIRDRLPSLLRVARTPEIRLTDRDGDAVVRGALASAITGGTGAPADR
ncbi:ROK family protein [Haloplanus rubicundus]|uniref:ROK family protein n=1 Tax=Haloplanus rubicundus TaxID=1547898 RepID=A0A345EHD3_9EURY|nr:ROK family protein [Haloplanus rubicundus]AXG05133.1 ROK family protein [Haloplanus rubicundus]AXG11605.1 ROK family protein [Haloplanus rubicundus]